MHLTTLGQKSQTRNLSTVVDVLRAKQIHTRVGRNESIQIDHRSVFPEEPGCGYVVAPGVAHNLHLRIDTERDTATSAAFVIRGPEITHNTLLPEKRVPYHVARIVGSANDISVLGKPEWFYDTSSKSAEVGKPFMVTEKGALY